MNRRAVLMLFGKAAAAGVAFGFTRTPLVTIVSSATPTAHQTDTTTSAYDAQLQAAIDKISATEYSEVGVPMILACEDLTSSTPVPARYSKPMNDAVAGAFQRYTDSWNRMHPTAPATDLPKLVELLSARDFRSGGKDDSL
jgi:hypothetical protein